jgi:hypothetical protein
MTILSNLINIGKDFNMYSELSNTIENISTTITLTDTAFGKLHRITGTSADYTITLPAASGNLGKIIGFVVDGTATKLFTIDGNSTETIDGETTRVLWANESAILLCDGTGWTKIAGKSIPMSAVIRNNASQSITLNTATTVIFNTTDYLNAPAAFIDTNSFKILRKSVYTVSFNSVYNANTALTTYLYLDDYSVVTNRLSLDKYSSDFKTYSGVFNIDANKNLYMSFTAAVSSNLRGNERETFVNFRISEIPTW